MTTHISNLKTMTRRLMSDLGKPIDETDLVVKLLELPSRYWNLISAWDNLDESKQTVANLLSRLLKEGKQEFGMPSPVTISSENSIALAAKVKRGDDKTHTKPKKFEGKCNYCQKVRDKKNKCWKLQKDRKAESKGGSAKAEASSVLHQTGSYMTS